MRDKMEYKFTTPYARFQEWLDQCPVEIVNYVDFTDTFDITFKVPVEEEVDNSSNYLDSFCLLYTSPSPRDLSTSRMPSSA